MAKRTKMGKKVIGCLLVALMVAGVAACGKSMTNNVVNAAEISSMGSTEETKSDEATVESEEDVSETDLETVSGTDETTEDETVSDEAEPEEESTTDTEGSSAEAESVTTEAESTSADEETTEEETEESATAESEAESEIEAEAETEAEPEVEEEIVMEAEYTEPLLYYATVSLNIREKPNKDSAKVSVYGAGDEVYVYGMATNGWAKVEQGWVKASYLSTEKPVVKTAYSLQARTVATGISFSEKVAAFADELANATYSYQSDTLFVTMNKTSYGSGIYWITHVIISDPSQIHEGLSNGTWGGTRQLPTSAASDTGAIVMTNGSYFSYDTGQPACAGVFISNGTVMKDGTTSGGEVCLKSDGTLYTPAKGLSAQDLLDAGVVSNWGTADILLIQDGVLQTISSDKSYPRTAIGMVEACEYYIITAADGNYNNGLTFTQLQTIFSTLGCTYARSLDGGGSASLVFKGSLINNPAAGSQRAVTDFLYFTN